MFYNLVSFDQMKAAEVSIRDFLKNNNNCSLLTPNIKMV